MNFVNLLAIIAIGSFVASFFIFRNIYKDTLRDEAG